MAYPITAIMIAKDNPPYLFDSLDSFRDFVSEIIIADIGINEEVKKKLIPYGVKLITIQDEIPFVELVREKLKSLATHPYILFIDPDEILPQPLKKEWGKILKKYDYITSARKNIIMGQWIQNSRWWPDYQTRLFKKNKVIWPKTIHKQPITTGNGYRMKAEENLAILHYNYGTIDDYFSKMTRYAKAEAYSQEFTEIKPTFLSVSKNAVSEFISRYFAGNGYKDGIRGFILAFFQMIYPFLVYFYYLESRKFNEPLSNEKLTESSTLFFSRIFKESLFWRKKEGKITITERIIEKIIK